MMDGACRETKGTQRRGLRRESGDYFRHWCELCPLHHSQGTVAPCTLTLVHGWTSLPQLASEATEVLRGHGTHKHSSDRGRRGVAGVTLPITVYGRSPSTLGSSDASEGQAGVAASRWKT